MPLKYDKNFGCIRCLLFTWRPLWLDVIFELGDFRLFKKWMEDFVKRRAFNVLFIFGNRKKSHGA